jgi:sulfopyruvate decarboxylase TPP-binding subunit
MSHNASGVVDLALNTSTPGAAGAERLDPKAIHDAIRATGVTHIVTVPDTHQRTLLTVLLDSSEPILIQACTEDEVLGINLGLYMGGKKPLVLIQNTGFFASMNALRGVSLEAKAPTVLLIGEFSRDPGAAPVEHSRGLVYALEPTLDLWKVPYYRLDHPADIKSIGVAVERAFSERCAVALLVGAPTAETP